MASWSSACVSTRHRAGQPCVPGAVDPWDGRHRTTCGRAGLRFEDPRPCCRNEHTCPEQRCRGAEARGALEQDSCGRGTVRRVASAGSCRASVPSVVPGPAPRERVTHRVPGLLSQAAMASGSEGVPAPAPRRLQPRSSWHGCVATSGRTGSAGTWAVRPTSWGGKMLARAGEQFPWRQALTLEFCATRVCDTRPLWVGVHRGPAAPVPRAVSHVWQGHSSLTRLTARRQASTASRRPCGIWGSPRCGRQAQDSGLGQEALQEGCGSAGRWGSCSAGLPKGALGHRG